MYGGLAFVRWALVEREAEPRLETEEWWRREAGKGKVRRAPTPKHEPISTEELRDRLRVLGWS
jgi:hypothetical protein